MKIQRKKLWRNTKKKVSTGWLQIENELIKIGFYSQKMLWFLHIRGTDILTMKLLIFTLKNYPKIIMKSSKQEKFKIKKLDC